MEAAGILNVSHPFLIRLLDEKVIPIAGSVNIAGY